MNDMQKRGQKIDLLISSISQNWYMAAMYADMRKEFELNQCLIRIDKLVYELRIEMHEVTKSMNLGDLNHER